MYYTSAHLQEMKGRKNRWRGVLKYKDPETGKWRERKKTFEGVSRRRDAQVELSKWRQSMEASAPIIGWKRPIDRIVDDYLDTQFGLSQISDTTYNDMKRINQLVIRPKFGKKPFSEITRQDIQRFVNRLARDYEPSTVRKYYAILRKAFKHALREEVLLKDPTIGVSLPRIKKKQINYLDYEGRKRFLTLMKRGSPYYTASMIAYYCGLRTGEICGLQWKDISFTPPEITIRQTAICFRDEKRGGQYVVKIGAPKTPKSKRTIPMPEALYNILREEELLLNHPDPEDYVIELRNPKLLSTGFQKWSHRRDVLGMAGKPITMHGLRHTFATLGVQSGMDVKSLSSILGHSNAAMTLDTYASDDTTAKRAAMRNLSQFFDRDVPFEQVDTEGEPNKPSPYEAMPRDTAIYATVPQYLDSTEDDEDFPQIFDRESDLEPFEDTPQTPKYSENIPHDFGPESNLSPSEFEPESNPVPPEPDTNPTPEPDEPDDEPTPEPDEFDPERKPESGSEPERESAPEPEPTPKLESEPTESVPDVLPSSDDEPNEPLTSKNRLDRASENSEA